MTQQPSMEEVIKQQKEQCIFCKIVKGEIPSTKVFEDDLILAVMDINPAAKGHVVILPKEHYPIMPLIPRETFEHMIKISKYIGRAQQDALHVDRNSFFIANGSVAGQQSAHFMMHIIPRNEGDKLSFLDAMGDLAKDDAKAIEIGNTIGPNLNAALHQLGEQHESVAKFINSETVREPEVQKEEILPEQRREASPEQKQKISELYKSNEEFRDLILNKVDLLKEKVKSHPKWAALFDGINIDALSAKLNDIDKQR